MSKLADAKVLTMECVGEFLKVNCDKYVSVYFARHFIHLFPILAHIDRTTFVRQATSLWHLKGVVWRRLAEEVAPSDDRLHSVDSTTVLVCRLTHVPSAGTSRVVRYGKNQADRRTFYGFCSYVRLIWLGLLSRVALAPASQLE